MSRTKKIVDQINDDMASKEIPWQVIDLPESEEAYKRTMPNSHSDELPATSIYQALSDFQQEMPIMGQNAQGYGYKYVDLAEITRVITPLLRKHGLGYTQPLCDDGVIKTILFHYPTGQTIESRVQMPMGVQLKGMNDFQVYGNAISYFRRYSLSSILGLVSDKDLDASGEQLKPEAPAKDAGRPWTKNYKKTLTNKQVSDAIILIEQGEFTKDKLTTKYALTEEQLALIKHL